MPTWITYYPDISSATTEQKKYYAYWLRNIRRRNYPDIGRSLSYFFVFAYEQIHAFLQTKNIRQLESTFGSLQVGYPNLAPYLQSWLGDAYLYLENYNEAWNSYKKNWNAKNTGRLRVADFLNIQFRTDNTSIDGYDLVSLLGMSSYAGITKFGKEHIEGVVSVASLLLNDFQVENGKNLIRFNLERIDRHHSLSENDFAELKKMIGDEKEFLLFKKIYFEGKQRHAKYPQYDYSRYGRGLFNGYPGSTPTLSFQAIPGIVEVAVLKQAQRILREAENTVREEMGIPKIGEGWVSETELFYRVKKSFPTEEVLHHGRPEWLVPQHLDIFFPKRNIGIEYQGQQHVQPTEYFGGEKAFKLQVQRDLRKKKKCEKNKCRIVYVFDGYDFTKLSNEIGQIIAHPEAEQSETKIE